MGRRPRAAAALLLALLLGLYSAAPARDAAVPEITVVEASVADLQAAMTAGTTTAEQIVRLYLERIERYEDRLHATMVVNPHALADARRLDTERAEGRVRGPLHGIPVALKDNIQTRDMPTTGGALAFAGFVPPYDATLVTRLEEAGAIVLAKTTLTELANWVGTGMPNSYNALRGYGYNPYDPRPDPRPGFDDGRPVLDPGGSSSGIGTTVSFWTASVGTETSGSIQAPASNTGLAAIKPTVGRVSRHGIIPITLDQDTAGPMAKYVADAAALLAAMEGPDPNDAATGRCPAPGPDGYADRLRRDALDGARIGIPRAFFYEPVIPPGAAASRGGLSPAQSAVMARAIELLERLGADIVDPADIPSVVSPEPWGNQLLFGNCFSLAQGKGGDAHCSVVLKYGMKRDFDLWLESLGDAAPLASLTDLRDFNLRHRDRNAIRYGQAQLDISDQMDVVADRERWRADRARDLRLSRAEGIDAVLEAHRLDALLMPSWHGENILNKAGYPAVLVPFAEISLELDPPLPEDFGLAPLPFAVTFVGTACSEPRLIGLAYAFEQASRARRPPPLFP